MDGPPPPAHTPRGDPQSPGGGGASSQGEAKLLPERRLLRRPVDGVRPRAARGVVLVNGLRERNQLRLVRVSEDLQVRSGPRSDQTINTNQKWIINELID